MNKQYYLDLENPTPEEWIIQQLIIGYSKTALINLQRTTNKLNAQIYKTSARNISFSSFIGCVNIATNVLTESNDNLEKQ